MTQLNEQSTLVLLKENLGTSLLSIGLTDEINGNVLHIDSGTTHSLILTVSNNSNQPITIHPLSSNPSEQNSNFFLKFDNNSFSFDTPPQVSEPSNWKAAANQIQTRDGTYSNEIYLLTTQEVILQPKGNNGDSIAITMLYSNAYPGDFAFAVDTRIFISGQHVTAQGETLPGHEDLQLLLLEDEGLPIPLAAELVGPRTILNDGTATLDLKLRIINPLPEAVQFEKPSTGSSTPTKIRVRVQLSNETTAYWALCTTSEATDLGLSVPDHWTRTSSSNENEKSWEIQPDYSQIQQIEGNSVLELTLSNVKSSLAPGFTDVFVEFQNFPVFGTQTKVVQIEKSPLIYSSHYVGIRTNNPSIDLAIGDSDTGLKQQGDGQLAIYTNNAERVRVNASGYVGIGTTSPAESLHIKSGNLRIDSGQIKSWGPIVFCSDVDCTGDSDSVRFLRQTSETETESLMVLTKDGHLGIGTTSPQIDLAIGDSDTGLQQQGDGELAIYTNNAERLRVNSSGNVGIGTTSPDSRLEISGSNDALHLYGTQSPNNHGAKLRFGDGDYLYLQEDSDDHLLIHAREGVTFTGGTVNVPALQIGSTSIGESELQTLKRLAAGQLNIFLRNVEYGYYAYGSTSYKYDGSRGYMFLWLDGGPVRNGEWCIEPI